MADHSAKAARPTEDSVRARMAEAGFAGFAGNAAGSEGFVTATGPDISGIAANLPDVSGVVANLIVLQDHVATLRSFALDPRSASAMRFEA